MQREGPLQKVRHMVPLCFMLLQLLSRLPAKCAELTFHQRAALAHLAPPMVARILPLLALFCDDIFLVPMAQIML